MLGGAEQGRKARIRIEARPAQPVDRAVRADECGAFAVPNECVVLDPRRNELAFPRHDLFRKPASTFRDHACANSITTLMSPGLRSKPSAKRSSGTRRVIRRESQPRSARASASASIL